MKKYKIGIIGITGRMGRAVIEAMTEHENLECIGGISKNNSLENYKIFKSIDALCEESDILIDFSTPSLTVESCFSAKKYNKPIITGTTGIVEKDMHKIKEVSENIPILMSANFSIGMNLMGRLISNIAPILYSKKYDIEVMEKHHRCKKDAPSGTAFLLGKLLAKAIGQNENEVIVLNDYRDKRQDGKIGIGFSRGGSVQGEHTVSFLGDNEVLEITHRVMNRKIFAEGALFAAIWIINKTAGLYSMDDVLS